MKVNTPLVTLLSGAALGAGVLIASMVWPSGASSASTSSAGGTGATPAATAATTIAVPASGSSTSATAPPATPATSPATATASAPATATGTASAPVTAPAATASAPTYVPPQADYVAQVSGGAAVAISVHGNKAVAYVCNGHAVAAWLRGKAVGGKLDLTGKNGARLMVDYHKGNASGYIMADGTTYTFSAPSVDGITSVHGVTSANKPPGLYEATGIVDGVSIKAGWIVLPDGGQVGSVEYDPTSALPPTAQAPVLDLATGTASYDGITLIASLISGITGSGF